jgi:hypothetical protein
MAIEAKKQPNRHGSGVQSRYLKGWEAQNGNPVELSDWLAAK